MTSHQIYNESPKPTERSKATMGSNDILLEISPTGIMGFPQSMSSGGSGKAVVPRSSGVPRLTRLDHENHKDDDDMIMPDDEMADCQFQQRIQATYQYWDAMEQEFLKNTNDRMAFFVPRCENPFEAFMVHQGHVSTLVQRWNNALHSCAEDDDDEEDLQEFAAPCGVPMPGDAVQKLVAFFNHLAEQRLLEESMEPFVAYKNNLSDDICNRVAECEEHFAATTKHYDNYHHQDDKEPVVVYRHVSPTIQPLVDFWNDQSRVREPPCLVETPVKKNPRMVVMANLMQKQLEHVDDMHALYHHYHAIEVDESTKCLVVSMVSRLEGMNYETRTGCANGASPLDVPLDVGHVHHVKPVPLVF